LKPDLESEPPRLGDHFDRVYRAAWALSGSPEGARELVERAYADLLGRARPLHDGDVARVLCAIRAAQGTRARRARPGRREPASASAEDGSARPGPDEVYAAIAALPERLRDAIVAVDVAGLSYRDAARVLRVREATMTGRLFHARSQLTRRLEARRG
jgi:RNA polymerase sigma-70 factor, ECF subfamily